MDENGDPIAGNQDTLQYPHHIHVDGPIALCMAAPLAQKDLFYLADKNGIVLGDRFIDLAFKQE